MKYSNLDPKSSLDVLSSIDSILDAPASSDKITISTSDVNYVSYLIQKGNIQEAKQVLANLKSTIKIIDDLINQTQNNLISFIKNN